VREFLQAEQELDRIFNAGLPAPSAERWSHLAQRAYALHLAWTERRAAASFRSFAQESDENAGLAVVLNLGRRSVGDG